MKKVFINTLMDIASKRKEICLITGDLGYGVLDPFIETYPERFINAGISEQNMTGVAAGMAKEGKTVVTYSIGNFPTMRCLEQIRNDCAYHDADVKIVCPGGGLSYGKLGMSHHATEDIAIMRALPNVKVFAPGDIVEVEKITEAMFKEKGTCYLRLGKCGEKIHKGLGTIEIGKAIKVQEGTDIAIFSTGSILGEVCKAVKKLEDEGLSIAQYSFPTIKPIDKDIILKKAKECKIIVSVEEHNIIGGLGSAVAEIMAENSGISRLIRIGINDTYTSIVGQEEYLRQQYGLSSNKIYNKIMEETS